MAKKRKERIEITYDVESGGAQVKKELPFVVGVMGDFSGDTKNEKAFKDRKFVEIDRENFDDTMSKISPSVRMKVDNTIENNGTEFAVELTFNSIEDFNPDNIVEQIPQLKKLMEMRQQLRELSTKADNSEQLESLLEQILQSDSSLQNLKVELDAGKPEE